MATRSVSRRRSRLRRRNRVPNAQIPLWDDEGSGQLWRPLDRDTRECGRLGVRQAREALEHLPPEE